MATSKRYIILAVIMVISLGTFTSMVSTNATPKESMIKVNPLIEEYTQNTRVQQWRHYFDVVQTKNPEAKRSREFYRTGILASLSKAGIPKERAEIYAEIPHVESLWRSSAISHRGALGLWQIMPNTARRFGFNPADMYDPDRATACAVRYISFLDSLYAGDVAAVLFSYNGGETGVSNHVKKHKTENVWHVEFTSRETYNFAPKVLGAWLYNNQYN